MFPNLNPMELMVVFGVAVLLFGKKLPDVSRSLGRGILEFKKSLRGIEEEFRSVAHTAGPEISSYLSTDVHGSAYHDAATPTAPKFQPPSAPAVPRMEREPSPYREPEPAESAAANS